jgi:hypothetical protein
MGLTFVVEAADLGAVALEITAGTITVMATAAMRPIRRTVGIYSTSA